MCCAGCDELKKSMKNAKNPLYLVIFLLHLKYGISIYVLILCGCLFYIDTAPDAFLPQELNVNMLHDL